MIPAFPMPTPEQFTALLNMVLVAHPVLKPKAGTEQEYRERVYAVFCYLSTVSRLPSGKFSEFYRTRLD